MDAKLLSRICSPDFIALGWNLILFNPVVLSLSLSLTLSFSLSLSLAFFLVPFLLSEKPIEDRTPAQRINRAKKRGESATTDVNFVPRQLPPLITAARVITPCRHVS